MQREGWEGASVSIWDGVGEREMIDLGIKLMAIIGCFSLITFLGGLVLMGAMHFKLKGSR